MKKIIIIKNTSILKWYNKNEKYYICNKKKITLNNKLYYIYDENHIISVDDCYDDEEIRKIKLKRILT